MSFPEWRIQPDAVFLASPVIPVIVINEMSDAIPLAEAVFAGGIQTLEVTLRTTVALDAIRLLTKTFPESLIGVGTVINSRQLDDAIDAGAKFAITPGQTQSLLVAGRKASIPLIPGIASISELMDGLEAGYNHFKFFPAVVAGGIQMLRAIHGPFPQAMFCPTGGINAENYWDYLKLPNVSCVGGSWIVPDQAIRKRDWALITHLCKSIQKKVIKEEITV